jgi:signal transduction histidine kinase
VGVAGIGEPGRGVIAESDASARAHPGPHVRSVMWNRIILRRALRAVWLPVSLLCAALVAVDAAIRYSGVASLSSGLPSGWTPGTMAGALRQLGLSSQVYASFGLALTVLTAIAWFTVAGLVAWRGWAAPMARFAAYFLVIFGTSWLIEMSRLPAAIRPAVRTLDAVSWTAFALFFFLFPSGRFEPRWLRWPVSAAMVAGVAVQATVVPGAPGSQLVPWLCLLAFAAAAQIWRYRFVSGPLERRQSRWLASGFSATLLAVGTLVGVGRLLGIRPPTAGALVYELAGQALGAMLFLPIPLAIVIGMARHGLWEAEALLNRALVYGGLSALIAAVYGLAVGTGFVVAGGRSLALSILIGALIAVLINPARSVLQRAVNRLMYGHRDEPYLLLARVGNQLEHLGEAGPLLASIAETVREGLRLPYAGIVVAGAAGERSGPVESGPPGSRVLRLPLAHNGRPVGELLVAPRAGEDELSRADLRVLEDLARPVAVAVRALALSDELQRAREHLVVAREEERRHLRRELHDGLGPVLAAHRLKLGSACASLTAGNAEAANRLLGELDEEMGRSVQTVRAVAYQLRPPVLDELGLLGALRAAADAPAPPTVSVCLAGVLPDLPAALEVATYRIAAEALTNVRRHAMAQNCEIAVQAANGVLTVTVNDDGYGLCPDLRPGVGLASMRERAEELGGRLAVQTRPGGGTSVVATLPFPGERS